MKQKSAVSRQAHALSMHPPLYVTSRLDTTNGITIQKEDEMNDIYTWINDTTLHIELANHSPVTISVEYAARGEFVIGLSGMNLSVENIGRYAAGLVMALSQVRKLEARQSANQGVKIGDFVCWTHAGVSRIGTVTDVLRHPTNPNNYGIEIRAEIVGKTRTFDIDSYQFDIVHVSRNELPSPSAS